MKDACKYILVAPMLFVVTADEGRLNRLPEAAREATSKAQSRPKGGGSGVTNSSDLRRASGKHRYIQPVPCAARF